MREDGYITASSAADAVGVHITTLYRWVESGKLTGTQVGRAWFVRVHDLLDMYSNAPGIQRRIRAAHADHP